MANHVQNNIKFLCDEDRLREILESIMYDPNGDNEDRGYGTIDFERIISMPQDLDIESGSRTSQGIEMYLTSLNPRATYFGKDKMDASEFEALVTKMNEGKRYPYKYELSIYEMDSMFDDADKKAQTFELGKKAVENFQKYGSPTWYEWRRDNWGTKWNSYNNIYDGGNTLYCQTAWSTPAEAILNLSKMFPDVSIEMEYADEDIGSNCGRILFKNGGVEEEYYPETRKEAVEHACSVWGYDPKEVCGLYLNATETDYVNPSYHEYDLISVMGKPALFSYERLTDSDVPKGLHVYHLRDSDNGDAFATLEPKVAVNFGGSVILNEEVDFGTNGCIDLRNEENAPNFYGYEISVFDYMEGNLKLDENMGETLC